MYLRESAFQTVLFYKTRILRKADFSSQFRTKSASQSTRRPLILATVNKPWRLFVEQQSKDYQLKSSDLKARKPASRPQVSDFATNRDPDLNCIVFCVHQLTFLVLRAGDIREAKNPGDPTAHTVQLARKFPVKKIQLGSHGYITSSPTSSDIPSWVIKPRSTVNEPPISVSSPFFAKVSTRSISKTQPYP